MILIDSNSLIVLVLGMIDPSLIEKNKRTSIYSHKDFEQLLEVIVDFKNLVLLPNIWTEVDNLLNRMPGRHRYTYVQTLMMLTKETTEQFLQSKVAIESPSFFDLGLTDSAILEVARECELLMTSDSKLSDHALALGINVYDLVAVRNSRLRG